MTEAEVNGLYAASLGVPVGVVTGDDEICDVARKAFSGVTAVEVKKATGYSATDSLHPSTAGAAIEAAAAAAVANAGALPAPQLPDALMLEVDFANPLMADYAASVPRTQRLSALTLRGAALASQQLGVLVHRR
jgi:D-amino peptidase